MAQKRRGRQSKTSRRQRAGARSETSLKDYLIGRDSKEEAAADASRSAAPPADGMADVWQIPMLPRETRDVLAQAMLLFSASGLRHYAGLIEAVGRRVPALARVLEGGETSEAEGADHLRACLREVADLSIEEARRLRAQLDRLDPASASAPETPAGPYFRRWKAKP